MLIAYKNLIRLLTVSALIEDYTEINKLFFEGIMNCTMIILTVWERG